MTITKPVWDPNNIIPALKSLKPGQSMEYYRGFLQDDRAHRTPSRSPETDDIHAIGAEAWKLYLAGKVHLTQRRLGPPLRMGCGPGFSYIATGATTGE